MPEPLHLFYSHNYGDEALRKVLDQHLKALERVGEIRCWSGREITASADWEKEVRRHLEEADIILLLISANFLGSDYCCEVEMRRALERHDRGEARVVPVILSPVDWMHLPAQRIQALPENGKPITTWPDTDQAYMSVAKGIRKLVRELRQQRDQAPVQRAPRPRPDDPPPPPPWLRPTRWLLAALTVALCYGGLLLADDCVDGRAPKLASQDVVVALAPAAQLAAQQLAQACQGRAPVGGLSCGQVVRGCQVSCWTAECVCQCMTTLALDQASYLLALNQCALLRCSAECARSPATCMACSQQRCGSELAACLSR